MIAIVTFILGFCVGVIVMAIFFTHGRAEKQSEMMLLEKKLRDAATANQK